MNASLSELIAGMSKFKQIILLLGLLNISLLNAQQVCRKYPLPGSMSVSPEVSIQVQFDTPYSNAASGENVELVVSGEKNGIYRGTLKQANDYTLIFTPETGFLTGDIIRIMMRDRSNPGNDLYYEFRIRDRVFSANESRNLYNMFRDEPPQIEPLVVKSETAINGYRPRLVNGIAVPSDFPEIIPSIQEKTAPGHIFMNNRTGPPYILIFKNDGTPYFYRKVVERSMDFKVQPTGVLSRRLRESPWGFATLDTNFRRIRTWNARGYVTDEHDMQLTLDGTAYMIGIDYRYMDLSGLVSGGDTLARVMGTLIQEVDSSGNVLFEWNGWDHFSITDAVFESLTNTFVDFIHTNSVAVDYDSNVVISSRHQSECTKINRQTGEVMWRLGGLHNQFTFMDGDSISYQHDIRPVPGKPDHYTIFDNGNHKEAVEYSRVIFKGSRIQA